jgi:AcrR family transcriptional regulator
VTWISWLGVALMAVSALAVLGVLLVAVLPPALRLRRVARITQALVEEYRLTVTTELWECQVLALERAVILQPVRRVQRVLAHPLVVALFESLLRRRSRSGAATLGTET